MTSREWIVIGLGVVAVAAMVYIAWKDSNP